MNHTLHMKGLQIGIFSYKLFSVKIMNIWIFISVFILILQFSNEARILTSFAKKIPYNCSEIICKEGYEPINCNKTNPGNGCKKCSDGYFSQLATYRKLIRFHLKAFWKEKFCIPR